MFKKSKMDREFMMGRIKNDMDYYKSKADACWELAMREDDMRIRDSYIRLHNDYTRCYLDMWEIYLQLKNM